MRVGETGHKAVKKRSTESPEELAEKGALEGGDLM